MVLKYLYLLIVLSKSYSELANSREECNYYGPDTSNSCGYSCIHQVSRWYFIDLMDRMPRCRSFFLYLSHGYYHSFPERFFSSIGHLDHFFLEITNVTFSYFPSSVSSISPFTDVVFDVSIFLQLVDIHVSRQWNWRAFQDLKADRGGTGTFDGYGLNMTRLNRDFSHVLHGSLRKVRFSGGNLKTLDDGVFTELHSLAEVLLHNNEIEEIKRNYFALPANVLELLVLSGNRIEYLPVDMFVDMPSLKKVDLARNPLVTLSEAAFRPILSRVQIYVKEQFNCTCDLRWVKYISKEENKRNNFKDIFCENPLQLRNQSLLEIEEEELKC